MGLGEGMIFGDCWCLRRVDDGDFEDVKNSCVIFI
jgi:hypothetical protein